MIDRGRFEAGDTFAQFLDPLLDNAPETGQRLPIEPEAVMHGFKGERVLMRIHIGEGDKFQGHSLVQQIVELLRNRHYAGATVFRATMGFGATARLRSSLVEYFSLDLPIVIECVETEEKIRAILPELDQMIGGGLITLERALVIMYRPHRPEEEEGDDWSLDVTGSWKAQETKQAR